MKETAIVYEVGNYWVAEMPTQYTVYQNGNVAAKADSSYPKTADGLSLSKARADYLAHK